MWREIDLQLCRASERGEVSEMERLIAAGADPSAFVKTPHVEHIPVHSAAIGQVAAIAALLKVGALVDGARSDGCTALVLAVANGHTAVVDALISGGADVHRRDSFGDTALHHAVQFGHVDAARALVEAGASVDVRNRGGERPIDHVRDNRDCSVSCVIPAIVSTWCAGVHRRSVPKVQRGHAPRAAADSRSVDSAACRRAGVLQRRVGGVTLGAATSSC